MLKAFLALVLAILIVGPITAGTLGRPGGSGGGFTGLGDYPDVCGPLETIARNAGDTANICSSVTAGSPAFSSVTAGTNTTALVVTGPGSLAVPTQAADNNTTQAASTAYVQTELGALGGAGLGITAGVMNTASNEAGFLFSNTIPPINDLALQIDSTGNGTSITTPTLNVQVGGTDFFIPGAREYPTADGDYLAYSSANGDWEYRQPAAATGTTSLIYTVDNDNTGGSEPADTAGYKIEGGTGDAGMRWLAATNELEVYYPAGGKFIVADPGDGDRELAFLDNTSEPVAPSANTVLYALGGELYKKDSGDSTNERLLLNTGNHGIIYRTATPITHTGTVAQTTVWTTTLPGNTLGDLTNRREVRVRLSGTYQDTGAAGFLTIRLDYGGTVWWGEAYPNETIAAPGRIWNAEFTIRNTSTTALQLINGNWFSSITGDNADYAGRTLMSGGHYWAPLRGTTAEDSTADQTVSLIVTLPNTDAGCIFTFETATMEVQ